MNTFDDIPSAPLHHNLSKKELWRLHKKERARLDRLRCAGSDTETDDDDDVERFAKLRATVKKAAQREHEREEIRQYTSVTCGTQTEEVDDAGKMKQHQLGYMYLKITPILPPENVRAPPTSSWLRRQLALLFNSFKVTEHNSIPPVTGLEKIATKISSKAIGLAGSVACTCLDKVGIHNVAADTVNKVRSKAGAVADGNRYVRNAHSYAQQFWPVLIAERFVSHVDEEVRGRIGRQGSEMEPSIDGTVN